MLGLFGKKDKEVKELNHVSWKMPSDINQLDPNQIKVTVYQNGFKLRDQQFRPLDTDANRAFLDEVMKDRVPAEVSRQFGSKASIVVEDRRNFVFNQAVSV